jgi:uncharacterized membrane protein YkvA (DUF1232 family)
MPGLARHWDPLPSGSEVTGLRIVLDLSSKDLRYFRDALKNVQRGALAGDELTVIREADKLKDEALASEPPEYVRVRIEKLGLLIRMLEDEDWSLKGEERKRVLNVLAYFADPDDIIPDRVPGLGYLDDAIMLQIVLQSLRHEIEAYEHFCEFRRDRNPSVVSLLRRRKNLHARMRRRRRSDRDSLRSRGTRAPRSLGLW